MDSSLPRTATSRVLVRGSAKSTTERLPKPSQDLAILAQVPTLALQDKNMGRARGTHK
jgi:hypothetical protein